VRPIAGIHVHWSSWTATWAAVTWPWWASQAKVAAAATTNELTEALIHVGGVNPIAR